MSNPKIIIKHIGKRFFDYVILIPRENGTTEMIRGMTSEGKEIIIPIQDEKERI